MKLLPLLLLALPSSGVWAQNVGDVFGGITYAQSRVKDTSTRNWGTFQPATLSLGLGVIAMPNLALEAFVLDGLRKDSNTIAPSTKAEVEIQSGYGFGIRPFVNLDNGWTTYLKLGRQFGEQNVAITSPTTQRSTQTSYAHTTYGVGLSYRLDNRWSVAFEYAKARTIASENTNTASTGLGLRYMF